MPSEDGQRTVRIVDGTIIKQPHEVKQVVAVWTAFANPLSKTQTCTAAVQPQERTTDSLLFFLLTAAAGPEAANPA